MFPKDAYPDVPRELLRRPRRNKRQELIDVLVEALEAAQGCDLDAITAHQVDAALAQARGEV